MNWLQRSFMATLLIVAIVTPALSGALVVRTPAEILAIDTASGEVLSRYGIPADVGNVQGLEWDGSRYLVGDSVGRQLWSLDEIFTDPSWRFAFPSAASITPAGIVLHAGALWLNGQSSVPPDTLFAIDPSTGEVLGRHAMPADVRNLKDITTDGTYLWGVDSSLRRLYRIDPTTAAFDLWFALPGANPTGTSVAYDPVLDAVWYVDRTIAHAIDTANSTPGGAVSVISTLPFAENVFGFAAVYRESVVPTEEASWGRIKALFGPR